MAGNIARSGGTLRTLLPPVQHIGNTTSSRRDGLSHCARLPPSLPQFAEARTKTIGATAQLWRARPLFTVSCATPGPEPPAKPETRAETGVGQEAADLGQTNTGCKAAPQTGPRGSQLLVRSTASAQYCSRCRKSHVVAQHDVEGSQCRVDACGCSLLAPGLRVPPHLHTIQPLRRRATDADAQSPTTLAAQKLQPFECIGAAAPAEQTAAQGHELVAFGALGTTLPARGQSRRKQAPDTQLLLVAVVGKDVRGDWRRPRLRKEQFQRRRLRHPLGAARAHSKKRAYAIARWVANSSVLSTAFSLTLAGCQLATCLARSWAQAFPYAMSLSSSLRLPAAAAVICPRHQNTWTSWRLSS